MYESLRAGETAAKGDERQRARAGDAGRGTRAGDAHEEGAVDHLQDRARHLELVEEPVRVEELREGTDAGQSRPCELSQARQPEGSTYDRRELPLSQRSARRASACSSRAGRPEETGGRRRRLDAR